MEKVKDSVECVKRIFSFDEHIVEAFCEYQVYGKNEEGRVPGPTDVQYSGYFTCDEGFVSELCDKYSWSEVKIKIVSNKMDIEKFNTTKWYYSKEFNKEAICPKYMGRIYFNGNFFWFDVSTN